MANLRDIRRRIKSVKNTRQITRAMQLVASSKMKRAQDAAVAGRPYAALLAELLATVGSKIKEQELKINHPFLQQREVRHRGVLLFSTDKGLCGPLNSNLFRKVIEDTDENTRFIAVGRKAAQFVSRTRRELLADFTISDYVTYAELRPLLFFIRDAFLEGKIDTIEIAFPRFINVLVQEPTIFPLIPVLDIDTALTQLRQIAGLPSIPEVSLDTREMLFEPDLETILSRLPGLYARTLIYQLLLESKASEYSARMVAMKAATDNASNLVDDLTLDYNKARQAAITQEILEIAAASSAA
jgi:F-type H+-transporting ATPase subunit gamma